MPLGRPIPTNIRESAPQRKQPKQRKKQKQHQRRGKYRTNDRYLLLIGLAAVSYLFLISQSIQLAGTSDVNIDDAFRESRRERRLYPHYGKPPKRKKQSLPKKKILLPVKVLHVAPDKLRLPKPIINVGFPKSGTSTIFSFFHCNGLKAQHWYCCEKQNHPGRTHKHKLMSNCMLKNLVAKAPIFEDCGDYDVYTEINGPRHTHENQHRTLLDDGTLLSQFESTSTKLRLFFPQHHRLDDIHQQYPNSTLIFNHRSVEAWIDSVQSWDKNLQFQILNEFYAQNSTRFLFENITNNEGDGRLHPAEASSKNTSSNKKDIRGLKKYKATPFTAQNMRKSLEIVYNYHLKYVRDWVGRHPSHALVEVDIVHENAGKSLAKSFGLNETCWGHFNKNDGEKNRNQQKGARGEIAASAQVNNEALLKHIIEWREKKQQALEE